MKKITKKTTQVPKHLEKENWKEEHLDYKHQDIFYAWCPLCMAKEEGERNDVKNNDLGVQVADVVKSKSVFGKK